MPRAILVNRFFHPDHSATAQILTDLAVFLAAEGWEVVVVTSRGRYDDPGAGLPAREAWRGVEVRRVWTSRFGRASLAGRALDYLTFYLTAFAALLALARRGDVVVAKTDPPLLSVPAALAARVKGARLVNWLQDLYPEVAGELGIRVPAGGLLRALRDRSLAAAAANVAIGERMAARLAGGGARGERIAVIHNWSDDEAIRPMAPAASRLRAEWGLEPDAFVVGYSGNLGRAHEAETALGAARLLRGRADIRFLFVGGGHHSGPLGARAAQEGLENVVFQPYQPRERLSDALAAADVHWVSLLPALEGLIVPSKVYGAAAAGRAVIAVADPDGEVARMVTGHGCGVAVRPGDAEGLARAIEALAADREACARMGERARAMLDARFARALSLARWRDLLEAVAAGRGPLTG